MKLFAALAVSLLFLVGACAAPAHADVTCQFPVVVLAIAGPVTLVCGDGNIANTNQTNSISPSLQVDPHLLAPAPH
jgi:hypothetical protein